MSVRTPGGEMALTDNTPLRADAYTVGVIPADYPDNTPWIDVRIEDPSGALGTWRLWHLPHTLHCIAPPVKPVTEATVAGGHFHGAAKLVRATHDPDRIISQATITCDKLPQLGPCCEYASALADREWEAPEGPHPGPYSSHGDVRKGQDIFSNGCWPVVYRGGKYLRTHIKLQEYAITNETVAFHNVSKVGAGPYAGFKVTTEESVLTPSGITITLPVQNPATFARHHMANLLVLASRTLPASAAPRLPLTRKYQRPIAVTLCCVADGLFDHTVDEADPEQANSSDHWFECEDIQKRSGAIRNLRFRVTERVDLRSYPLELVLPLVDKAGPEPPKQHAGAEARR